MDNQVRLLPAVIGAAVVLVILRLAAMSMGDELEFSGSGTASAADAAAPAPAQGAPAAPPAGPEQAVAAAPAAPSPGDKPAESKPAIEIGQAQNKGEADVLHGLSDRRDELDARENELVLREQLLAATQKQVDEKIAELKEIQSKLDTMLAQRDDAQKAQLTALVKMYENMKPADAAKIFEKLDRRILADVAGGMKPAKVGAVLAAMETAKAQELTALLANRLILPEPQQTSASAATAAAAIPAPPAAEPQAPPQPPGPPAG
jgi:flagellar motility protein MotE (MotC chaperone)